MAKDEPRTFPVDNHIPFDGRGMSKAYLSNGTPMKLFFDSGASRSYLSKRFYDSNPVLHDMPKFVTTCTRIRIGNGSIDVREFEKKIMVLSELQIKWHFKANFEDISCQSYRNVNVML